MARFIVLALAGIAFVSQSVSAAEKLPCGERAVIVKKLDAKFKEAGQARGLVSERQILEVFVSPSRSWTMLVSYPDGTSCIMATGQEWHQAPVALAGNGV
jgi:hypothetical protein